MRERSLKNPISQEFMATLVGEFIVAHTWDQEMLRLHHRIEELEKQNAKLRGMLVDAVGICDAALSEDAAERYELRGLQNELPLARKEGSR